jgi:hypothetical protein
VIVAQRANFVQLRARAPELRKRNEKKAQQAEKRKLLNTMAIMLS